MTIVPGLNPKPQRNRQARGGKQSTNATPAPQHEKASKSHSGSQERQPTSTKRSEKADKIIPSGHHAPPRLKKRVSFSDTLTRGRGKDYSPPAEGKAVHFVTSPVRGKGAEYNNLRPKNSENFLFRRHSTGNSKYPKSSRHTSIEQEKASSSDQSASAQLSDSDGMGVKGQRGKCEAPPDFDVGSDSDASFTDIVTTVKQPVDAREPLHRRLDTSTRHRPKSEIGSAQLLESLHGTVPEEVRGFQSEPGDNESYVDRLTNANTRKNSPYFGIPEAKVMNLPERPDKAKAPLFNRYGHQLRAASDGTATLAHSVRRSWPLPVFVWRTRSGIETSGRTNPIFVLRDGEAFNKAGPPERANKWRYHPPSITDDDQMDDVIRYDPVRRQTYRDV
ncbi:MAG: hypothetical protein Q9220_003928 [cf. Caloplaca sp. 1 TL-2023]